MIELPPELQDLVLPQYRQPMISREPVQLPWKDNDTFQAWLKRPVWNRRAFTADKDHLNSVLMSKPMGSLLSMAYLKSVRHHVHRNGLSYLASFTGPHRCQPAGDKVWMADMTWKNIEDVVIGDFVMSPQHPIRYAPSSWEYDSSMFIAKVLETSSHIEQDVYDVLRRDKRIYSCSREHPIPLFENGYAERTAEQISKMHGALTYRFGSQERIPIECIKTKPQRVYGFSLDSPSSLYITNDYYITHNTAKSCSASLFAHFWDTTFWDNFESRVIQSPYQFATTMNTIMQEEIIGAAVVVDEAGTTFAAGDWYEKWMRIVQKFLQTCGMLKPIILFVAPNREFIVSGMRKLIIAEHHMKKFKPEFSRMSCYHVKYNFMKKGDPYIFKRPMIRIAGQNITLKHINLYEPPSWFVERYRNLTEPDKKDRMQKWTAEVQKVISGQEEEGEPDYDEIIEDIWSKKELFFGRLMRNGTQKINQVEVETQYGLKPKYAKMICDRIERRTAEDKADKEEIAAVLAEKSDAQMAEASEQRLKLLKKKRVNELEELAPPKSDERAEQKENMDKELEDMLSSLDD